MTKINPADALDAGVRWLDIAARRFTEGDTANAHAAAIIGNGFTALAHATRAFDSMNEVSEVRQAILSLSDEPLTAEEEHRRRQQQTEAEARPHDDERLNSTPWDHAIDCQGDCEQPGKVPCGADEAIPDVIRHVHADSRVEIADASEAGRG